MSPDVLIRDNPHLSRPKKTLSRRPDNPSDEARSACLRIKLPASIGYVVQLPARRGATLSTDEVAGPVKPSVAINTRPGRPIRPHPFCRLGRPATAEPALVASYRAAYAEDRERRHARPPHGKCQMSLIQRAAEPLPVGFGPRHAAGRQGHARPLCPRWRAVTRPRGRIAPISSPLTCADEPAWCSAGGAR